MYVLIEQKQKLSDLMGGGENFHIKYHGTLDFHNIQIEKEK